MNALFQIASEVLLQCHGLLATYKFAPQQP